jgi:RHS repeat-associated protein
MSSKAVAIHSAGTLPMTQKAQRTFFNSYTGGYDAHSWTLTTLDGLGRVVSVQTGASGATTAYTETDTVYGPCACSPAGKMTQVSQPYMPGGPVFWTKYTYDGLGRTLSVQSPDGASTTTYLYQGNTTQVTDPAGKWKTTATDAQGNTIQVTEPDPSTPGSTLLTGYTYDEMEHLTQVSMTRGGVTQTRSFVYDAGTHLLTSETHPETGTTSYAYYTAGSPDPSTLDLLYSKTDAKGQVTKYDYDPYDRVAAIHRYPGGLNNAEDICQRVVYTYDQYTDAQSGFTSANAWGHVAAVAMGDPSCQATVANTQVAQQFLEMYSYKAQSAGHVIAKRLELYQQNGPPGYGGEYQAQWWDVGYSYNALGKLTSTTYPSVQNGGGGQTYTVGYDSTDRPTSLKDSRGIGAVLGVIYNAADQPFQTLFSAGSGFVFWENRGYNQLNQLTAINNFNTVNNQVNGPVQLTYTYSGAQNNGQIVSAADGTTVTNYTYDALKRLTAATATGGVNWAQSYTYDGFGNMTSKTGNGQTFTNLVDQTKNRLAYGNFCYDPDGNPISDQNGGGCSNPNYSYDVANRMVTAKVSGGTERYIYDADNKRISTIGAGGNQTVFIYGAMGEKLSVVTTAVGSLYSGATITNNVYFSGRLIKQGTDTISGANAAGVDMNFVAVDRVGSVKMAYGKQASVYLPYGEDLNATPADQVKFATYTRDGSTGLDYADQRFYTSQFGRFMSADRFHQTPSANDSGSWNKYAYTRGDPVNRVDHRGTCDTETEKFVFGDSGCDDDCWENPEFCDDGGGGGGPAPEPAPAKKTRPKDQVTDDLARGLLDARLQNFATSNCDKVFAKDIPSFNLSTFTGDVKSTEFYNTTGSFGSFTEDDVSGNGSSNQLNSIGRKAGSTRWGSLGNVVLLGGNFWANNNPTFRSNVLLHELVHVYTHWSDDQVFAAFAKDGLTHNDPYGTEEISAWLSADCTSTPTSMTWWK